MSEDQKELINRLRLSGADLSSYSSDLANDRNTQSLTLRRGDKPRISGLININKNFSQNKTTHIPQNPLSNPENVCKAIYSNDISTLTAFTNYLIEISPKSMKTVRFLASSNDICEAIISVLENTESYLIKIQLFNLISLIFPHSDITKNLYIDRGLVFIILNNISNEVSKELLISIFSTIVCISKCSRYARDSLLSFGIHTQLFEIVINSNEIDIINESCHLLKEIFSNSEEIDSTIISSSFSYIPLLLTINNFTAINYILNIITSFLNHFPQSVHDLFNSGVTPLIVQFLGNESTETSALSVIGNLSIGNPSELNILLNSGLLNILIPLIKSFNNPEVFWALSNLLNVIPNEIINLFEIEDIKSLIENFFLTNFEMKKELSFFISSYILITKQIIEYYNPSTISLITEMISSGNKTTSLKCLDLLYNFIIYLINNNINYDLIPLDYWEELKDSLIEIIEENKIDIKEKSNIILDLLSKFIK